MFYKFNNLIRFVFVCIVHMIEFLYNTHFNMYCISFTETLSFVNFLHKSIIFNNHLDFKSFINKLPSTTWLKVQPYDSQQRVNHIYPFIRYQFLLIKSVIYIILEFLFFERNRRRSGPTIHTETFHIRISVGRFDGL